MTQRKYGWKPQFPDFRDQIFRPTLSATIVPDHIDLRPDFANLPVFDQGALGSCTANSVGAALWYAKSIARNSMDALVPSRLFIYYNERLIEHTIRQDSGAMVRDSMKAVTKYGACCEAEWPYDIPKFLRKPPKAQYTSALTEERVQTYEAVGQYLMALQEAISSRHPVCIGISIYQSFESTEVAKTGIVPMPALSEELLGGHAVLLVGYDNNRRVFIARNSWSSDWGDKGYFYLPYDYVLSPRLAADFWIIKVC